MLFAGGPRKVLCIKFSVFKVRLQNSARGLDQKPIFMFERPLYVIRPFVGHKFRLYNGRYSRVFIFGPSMLGFRFGEFMFTRKFGYSGAVHMRRKKARK